MPMTTAHASNATSSVADLLAQVDKGDPAAWDEMLRRYGKQVSATVRSFRLQDADAHDAVQTTWLRLAENAHQVLLPERLGSWLATIAYRECLNILRRAKPARNLIGVAPETVADPSVGPEQRIVGADTARRLWKLVGELPPRQRTLLRALFTDTPQPYAEVARTAGIPPGAIGPTRARALRRLRARLEEHGLRPEPGDGALKPVSRV
ncbi:MAG TPA: sigma-70 family RNA polymerase sigma factor [Pseudonocardiaceae bacterium]|nr:sigma-70 family RNA polymerase sigma factor [Pseudonocardiaceae bacterium]